MPGKDINLIPEETYIAKEREKNLEKSILRSTVLLTFLSAIFILTALAYSFYLNSQATTTAKKIDVELQKIDQMRKREITLLRTRNKILGIQSILATRPLYEKQLKSLDFMVSFLNEGINMPNYSFNANNVNFEILAVNSDFIEKFVNNLLEENKNQPHFKFIRIESVDLQKEGAYKLSLTAILSD